MSSAAETVAVAVPRRRWRIAVLLGLGVLINYFDRINLSVAQDSLHTAFGISAITFGYLASAYNWTYALSQVPAGVLLDRFGVRRVGRVSTFLWSIASFGAAAATRIYSFLAARLLLGIAESPTFPGNAKAVGYWFPENERSFATSVFDAAAKFSSAIGIPIIGILLIRFGWRWSFATTGLASFAYFLLFYGIYRNPSEDRGLSRTELEAIVRGRAQPEMPQAKASSHASLAYLASRRKVLGLCLGFSAYNYTFYLLLTWLPSYFHAQLHIDLFHSVLFTAVPWVIAGASDLLIGGLLVDSLVKRGWNSSRVRQTVLIAGTALGVAIFGAATARTSASAMFWISVALTGLAASAPVAWSIPSLISPNSSVGRVGGILNFTSQICAIAAPIITGYVVQFTNSFRWAFVAAAGFLVLGIFGYSALLGRIERIPEES